MGALYTRGEAYVPVSTDGGTVNSITATYSGDLAEVFVQVHDSTPKATLTFADVGVATQVVIIGDTTYTWIATLSTDPTVPYEVLIGADQEASHLNLLRAITGGAGEGTLYSTDTVRNTQVRAYDGHADRADTTPYTASTKISVVAVDPTEVVVTTETGTNTDWDVATLPRLAASAVPRQSTAIGRFATVTTDPQVVDSGAIVVLSSAESIWTAVTYDDLYNGTVAEDRLSISVDFDADVNNIADGALDSDSDRVVDFKFDGDLVDNLGGLPLVKSGGTSVFIPSPIPGRGLAFRASVEHAEMASNQLNLEITEDLTLHMYVRRIETTDSVFLTFGNGASSAAADNHLYTVALVEATGLLVFSQENADGTNTNDTAAPMIDSREWVQITYTRATAGTSVKLYLNGILVDTSGALTKPTGGTAGVLTVGGTEGSVDAPMDFASLTIFNAELTADQVAAHCLRERS
jgi:hypothetical protein